MSREEKYAEEMEMIRELFTDLQEEPLKEDEGRKEVTNQNESLSIGGRPESVSIQDVGASMFGGRTFPFQFSD